MLFIVLQILFIDIAVVVVIKAKVTMAPWF